MTWHFRYLAKLKEKKKQKKRKPGDDDEREGDPRSELTAEELNDPFFASLDNDEAEYDPIRVFKSRMKEEQKANKEYNSDNSE